MQPDGEVPVVQAAREARAFNFCSGPAMLPEPVLQQIQSEFLNYRGLGASVMELSHRSDTLVGLFEEAEHRLRHLLSISSDYAVLFLQGGATLQFSAVPLNLMKVSGQADYLLTGAWSEKAANEAKRFGEVSIVASDAEAGYRNVPALETWRCNPNADYLHVTPNETIHGVEFTFLPDTTVPVVADMSSTILSRPLDVSRFGLIYAGAQKNVGPVGLTLVIVRRDLLKAPELSLPSLLRYDLQAQQASMVNTPPTFSVYAANLVFQWIEAQGGVEAMGRQNQGKAQKLYAFLDNNDFYHNPVAVNARSWMNIPFVLAEERLNQTFLREAEAARLLNLKGHRSVGGMRASLYNAMPEAGVDALIDFLQDFSQRRA